MQHPGPQETQPPSAASPRRPARSKNGCMTCRRRKVRCNEIRPICGHCSRLNLECRWRPSNTAILLPGNHSNTTSASRRASEASAGPSSRAFSIASSSPAAASPSGTFDDVFNYASFMWEGGAATDSGGGGDVWRCPAWVQSGGGVPSMEPGLAQVMTPSFSSAFSPAGSNGFDITIASNPPESNPASSIIEDGSLIPNVTVQDRALLDYFVQSVVPPIIAQVETDQKWASMRQTLLSMSRTCSMLRHAILTFSALLLSRQGDLSSTGKTQEHYDNTISELANYGNSIIQPDHVPSRAAVLATLFFLSYTDLLEGRMESTHASLNRAYDIYQSSDKTHFRAIELRILSWIRLIDARAVSAGGQGLFLSESDERLFAHSSPGSFDGDPAAPATATTTEEQTETDIEETLFDILYEPGIVFFQKVQSFMGRISHLDPWHRPRGTVEDETDVMRIASEISRDLRQLYDDSRPPLMDYAVAGRLLVSRHVSPNLAFTITRAFRTFLCNYHASKIHLHRVAYKTLPLTRETTESVASIRNLAKLLVDGADGHMLPVNMLWPLLMWGTEETNVEERAWIRNEILRMEKVATNARITSQVLEEVQKRQDSMNARQDVREVMEHIFNSCFAIV